MTAGEWEKFRRLVYQYKGGKISRERFVLEWRIAQNNIVDDNKNIRRLGNG